MAVEVVTAPATFPVSTSEAKAHLRVTHSDEDTYIGTLIQAATKYIEQYTGRSFEERTLRLYLDKFSPSIQLPRGPVTAVTSVQYIDTDGVLQTVASSVYTTDLISDPQWIVRLQDEVWPTTQDVINAVRVNYTAGETSPADIKHAVLLLVGKWYDKREDGSSMSGLPANHEVFHLLENHRSF